MDHPKSVTFEAFVIGGLDPPESAAFVDHVSTCEACATKLSVEAQAELAVLEIHGEAQVRAQARARAPSVAKGPVRPLRRSSLSRWAWGSAGALALAATVLLVLFMRRDHGAAAVSPMTVSAPRSSAPLPLVICHDGTGQSACIEDAHRHGLFVGYPPWAASPPFGGGRAGKGPTGSPFPAPQM